MSKKNHLILLGFTLVLTSALGLNGFTAAISAQSTPPSVTPSPASTLTLTFAQSLQLPEWISDPDALVAILALSDDRDSRSQWTFLNLESGERYVPDLPGLDWMEWIIAVDGVYVRFTRYQQTDDNQERFYEYVGVDNDRYVRVSFDEPSGLITPTPTPLGADNGAEYRYEVSIEQAEWQPVQTEASSYQNYEVTARGEVILRNTETNEILYTINRVTANGHPLTLQWFAEGQYLGVVYYAGPALGDVIQIIGTDGTPYYWQEWVFQPRWSPYHARMLYRYYYGICILVSFPEHGPDETNCEFLDGWEDQNEIQDYQWSEDGQKVFFTYLRDFGREGGLCVVDVETYVIDCPIQRRVENGTFRGSYEHRFGNAYGVFTYTNLINGRDDWQDDIPHETEACIISQSDYSVNCFNDELMPTDDDRYIIGTSLSPSGEMLALMYRLQRQVDEGICFVHVQAGDGSCPEPRLPLPIDTYGWSPDSRFFLLSTGFGPGSHIRTEGSSIFQFNTEDGTYQWLGRGWVDPEVFTVWRPPLDS